MNLGEHRVLTKDLPDNTDMIIYNRSSEWYGAEIMHAAAWELIGTSLVFDFSNCPSTAEDAQNRANDIASIC